MDRAPSTGLVLGALALAGVLSFAGAAAAEPTAADKATAEALFDQGRGLLKGGHTLEACPKFAESQRLDPGVGTLLYLAECYERAGQTASAWATFREAGALARVGGDTKREALAKEHATKLEPLLPKLVVNAPDLAGLVVEDGTSVLAKARGARRCRWTRARTRSSRARRGTGTRASP